MIEYAFPTCVCHTIYHLFSYEPCVIKDFFRIPNTVPWKHGNNSGIICYIHDYVQCYFCVFVCFLCLCKTQLIHFCALYITIWLYWRITEVWWKTSNRKHIGAGTSRYENWNTMGDNILAAGEIPKQYGEFEILRLQNSLDIDDDGLEAPITILHYKSTPLTSEGRWPPQHFKIKCINISSKFDSILTLLEIVKNQNVSFHIICIQES